MTVDVSRETDLDRAWAAGYTAGQARIPVGDVWVETPIRWRHVSVGDVLRMNGGRLWMVTYTCTDSSSGQVTIAAVAGNTQINPGEVPPLDPDGVVHILERFTTTDALTLTRDQLGARVIARKVQP